LIEQRREIPEITKYLRNTLKRQKSLECPINNVFNANELSEKLHAGLPNGDCNSQKEVFSHDITSLAEQFFNRTESKRTKLKIEIVKTDMCRLFHVDNFRQRLLCTYLGPGTEWLNNSNVNRSALGKGCNQNIVKDIVKVNKANEFDVLVLKGSKYGNQHPGVVHRSPPIEKQGITRVLLKVEEID